MSMIFIHYFLKGNRLLTDKFILFLYFILYISNKIEFLLFVIIANLIFFNINRVVYEINIIIY